MPRKQRKRAEYKLVKIEGRRNWYVRYSEPGSRRSKIKSTGIPLNDRVRAESFLASFKSIAEAPPPDATIGQLIDRYLDDKEDLRTIVRMRSFAKPLKEYFGDRTPDQITSALISRYLPFRKKMIPSVRRELELLIQIHNHAGVAPGAKISLPAPKPPRDVVASREQAQKLLQASTGHTHLFILIAMATGARKGAILDLTWDRVDEDRRIVDFNNPEIQITKKRRAVTPIPSSVAAALRDQREIAMTENVIEFGGEIVSEIRRSFNSAAVDAGFISGYKKVKNYKTGELEKSPYSWLTPHVLKHSVISWLAEDGWTVDQISDFTNTHHNTVRRVYRKVNPESLRGMADSLSFCELVPTPLALIKSDKISKHSRK